MKIKLAIKRFRKALKLKDNELTYMQICPKYVQAVKNSDDFTLAEMKRWLLRPCDRKDFQDWLPHLTIQKDFPLPHVITYFVNVNPASPSYNNAITLSVGKVPIITEYDDYKIVSSVVAAVEQNPQAEKPTPDEVIKLAGFASQVGGVRDETKLPTINGKPVGLPDIIN
jgi:hypothetical protein